MAYVNVKEWSPDQVTEWLRGLDNGIFPYINSFLNNGVKGHQLLSLRSDDLEHLGVYTIGHQELILEAVEHLRNFHYELDRENLQWLALRLSCASRSLYNELLSVQDTSKVETQTMSDVANIITTIKPLVCWLDRAPFSGQTDYTDRKLKLLQLSLEMATCAQRDRFAERPVEGIRESCRELAGLADHIIQDISDPMLLQPASLDLATLKKKENELGFSLMPSYHGVHQIADIKFASPAHTSNKLEEGDEIVQVNYQTVVGWQRKKVLGLFQESPPDIVLTLKKRPRHTKVYGQIYMKPYRLPSKKRQTPYSRWNDNLPSPRPELLTIPDFEMPLPRLPPIVTPQVLESESSSDSEPPDSPLESQGRVYPLKPRPVLQRRNTITGASPTSKRPHQAIEQYWNELKHQAAYKHSSSTCIERDNYNRDSVYLRDKSASCGHGLELTQRPQTYPKKFDKTFITDKNEKSTHEKKKVNFEDKKVIFEERVVEHKFEVNPDNPIENKKQNVTSIILNASSDVFEQNLEKCISVNSLTSTANSDEPIKYIDETVDEMYDRSHMNPEWKNEIINEIIKSINEGGTNTPTNSPEKMEHPQKPIIIPRQIEKPKLYKKPPEIPAKPIKPDILKKPVVPPRNITTKLTRGRLDKSHSTPAYDLTPENEKVDVRSAPEIVITRPETADVAVDVKNEGNKPEVFKSVENKINYEPAPIMEVKPIIDIRSEVKVKKPEQNKPVDLEPLKIIPKHLPLKETEIHEDIPKLEPKYITKIHETPPEPPPRTIYGQMTESPAKMKHFEPKSVSTPITKTPMMEFPSIDVQKNVTELCKASSETKISPTNSVVRAMIASNKNKTGKKKSILLAKRRKVAVKDLSPCDFQGYLYQRSKNKHTQNVNWERSWFVLCGSSLYGFKTKDALKADYLIFLTGFTVAVAHEVKSRSNAFKVYHTGKAFYFSAENSETMTSWVEFITAATLHSDGSKSTDSALFSETDDSDTDKPKLEKEKETPRKFGSLKKFTSKKTSENTTHNESTSLDRKYLRFFNNSSSKTKNQLPVPTSQFRSYRKVVPPNLVVNQNVSNFAPAGNKPNKQEVPKLLETQSISGSNLNLENKTDQNCGAKQSKLKPKPINYIHASNPSLCDISDYRFQSFYNKTRQFTQRSENLSGFVTLEQFMLNRQEEERKQNFGQDDVHINPNTIQPDVVYGEVRLPYKQTGDSRTYDTRRKESEGNHQRKYSDEPKKSHSRTNSDHSGIIYEENKHRHRKQSHEDSYKSDLQSRTLPKTEKTMDHHNRSLPRSDKRHDHYTYEESSQLVSDVKISEPYELLYADKKTLKMSTENSHIRERSYELIYCPQKVNDVQFAQNRTLDAQKKYSDNKKSSRLTRQHSLSSADKKDTKVFNRGESPEKFWLDSLRRSEKVTDKNPKIKLKSATQYTPMCIPLTPDSKGKLNPKFAFELNLDEKSNKSGKFNFFGKQSDKKEKTLLGSPRLHRALFGKHSDSESDRPLEALQVAPLSTNSLSLNPKNALYNSPSSSTAIAPPPDYPGLEYPPVFEPETYSLANPSSSLTLLRKQQPK